MNIKKDLLYLTQGFDSKYPLGFLTRFGCVQVQTTERSADGSPRYCQNPNAEGTFPITHFNSPEYVALNSEEELETALDYECLKKDGFYG